MLADPTIIFAEPSACGRRRRRSQYTIRLLHTDWMNPTFILRTFRLSANRGGSPHWAACDTLTSLLPVRSLDVRAMFNKLDNTFLGSWDGEIRIWKVDSKLRSFSQVGSIPALGVVNSLQFLSFSGNLSSGYSWMRQSTGSSSNSAAALTAGSKSLLLVAGVGQEMRLGRWVQKKGEGVLNGALVLGFSARTS